MTNSGPSPDVSEAVIGAFFEVYNLLRPGFLEAVYARALEVELRLRGIAVQREACITVWYKGHEVGSYRADLLVDGWIIVEIKATKVLDESARYQLLNYLRATGLSLGLLLHFGPKASFQRVVNRGDGRNFTFTRSDYR